MNNENYCFNSPIPSEESTSKKQITRYNYLNLFLLAFQSDQLEQLLVRWIILHLIMVN